VGNALIHLCNKHQTRHDKDSTANAKHARQETSSYSYKGYGEEWYWLWLLT
jgi:hypothetical protein